MERCFELKGYEAARCVIDGCHKKAEDHLFLFESSQYFNDKTSNYYYILTLAAGSVGGMGLR